MKMCARVAYDYVFSLDNNSKSCNIICGIEVSVLQVKFVYVLFMFLPGAITC